MTSYAKHCQNMWIKRSSSKVYTCMSQCALRGGGLEFKFSSLPSFSLPLHFLFGAWRIELCVPLCSLAFLSRLFSFIFSWTSFPPPTSYTFFLATQSEHTHTYTSTLRMQISIQHYVFVWGRVAMQHTKVLKPPVRPDSNSSKGPIATEPFWKKAGLSSQRQEHVYSRVTLVRSPHALHYVCNRVFIRATFTRCCSHTERHIACIHTHIHLYTVV